MRRPRALRPLLGLLGVLALSAPAAGQAGARSAAPADGSPYPKPVGSHAVRLETLVMVPTRDGVRLATDLYLPEGADGKLPAILIRTPYNRKGFRVAGSAARFFASHGYVVAVQDVRGKWDSEGEYVVQGHDPEDGYDTVDWLSKQRWSNGRVGTYGCSYLGDVQVMQAPLRHPALRAMIPQASGSSNGRYANRYHYFGVRNGGAFELAPAVGWFLGSGSKLYYRAPPGTPDSLRARYADMFDPAPHPGERTLRDLWWKLPVAAIMDSAGAPPTDWRDMLREPADPWWDRFGYLKGDERVDVPALLVNSWYDFGPAETLLQHQLFRDHAVSESARKNQFLLISPTTHCQSERATAHTVVGQRPVGDARLDYFRIYLDWFDHWLKGVENGVERMPHVRYYLMGKGEWRTADAWPVPGTRPTRYFLDGDGHANSRWGGGTLSPERPGRGPADRYVYDPRTPVPSLGGPICCTGTADAPEGAFDQSPVEARADVLVYSTPPLEQGVEVTGPLQAVLYVSSDARDTDFTAKLVDVYPDATAYNVQEGILRARYRDGFDRTVFMSADSVYELRVDMQATGNWFAPGHRIRLEVSSSNFPRFDRNLNTGGDNARETTWRVARNAIHHSERYPSHLLLPVVPASRTAAAGHR